MRVQVSGRSRSWYPRWAASSASWRAHSKLASKWGPGLNWSTAARRGKVYSPLFLERFFLELPFSRLKEPLALWLSVLRLSWESW